MNRLIQLLASCDLQDITSLKRIYDGNNLYHYYGVDIRCEETYSSTPECIRFILEFPLVALGIKKIDSGLEIAASDFCLRKFGNEIHSINLAKEHQTKKEKFTGSISIFTPDQRILLRNSAYYNECKIYISLQIKFPVHMMEKRNVIAGKLSVRIIKKELAKAIRNFIEQFDHFEYNQWLTVYRHQQEIRKLIRENNWIGFISNGSILPRTNEDYPLPNAVPFSSPSEDEVELTLSDGFIVKGMALKKGVTVIIGGGYSGKSTLLEGLIAGIDNHIPGDGREFCIQCSDSCKIVAEDGRSISSLDISPFIQNVNFDTKCFSTMHASGSISQAANIIEAISFGCKALLIDEDRTATNFMIRDTRMKAIIKDDPIIPFTDSVRDIYYKQQVSTILVIGGNSEYIDIADNVYLMKDYKLQRLNVLNNPPIDNSTNTRYDSKINYSQKRIAKFSKYMSYRKTNEGRIREYIKIDKKNLSIGCYEMNLTHLETIRSPQQCNAIAQIIRYYMITFGDYQKDLYFEMLKLYNRIYVDGLNIIYSNTLDLPYDMEMPSLHDILFAVSRLVPEEIFRNEPDKKPLIESIFTEKNIHENNT